MKIKKKVILFFLNYLHLQIWTLKICNHDISKSNMKLSRSISENLKKSYFIFFELSPFADLDFENL